MYAGRGGAGPRRPLTSQATEGENVSVRRTGSRLPQEQAGEEGMEIVRVDEFAGADEARQAPRGRGSAPAGLRGTDGEGVAAFGPGEGPALRSGQAEVLAEGQGGGMVPCCGGFEPGIRRDRAAVRQDRTLRPDAAEQRQDEQEDDRTAFHGRKDTHFLFSLSRISPPRRHGRAGEAVLRSVKNRGNTSGLLQLRRTFWLRTVTFFLITRKRKCIPVRLDRLEDVVLLRNIEIIQNGAGVCSCPLLLYKWYY